MATHTARVFALAVALLALGVSGAGAAGPARAGQAENLAGLIVQFTESDVRTYCLAFEGESISGLDLLLKSGLDLKVEAFGAMGAQVCKIDATGCDYPGEPCVCQSYGPGGVYWSYHHLREGTWRTSIVGASSYTVRPGEVEGWAWSGGAPPAQTYSFEQLCPAEQPPAPTPTQPPPPSATATPVPVAPSATPPPPATPTPQPPQATATQPPVPPSDTPTTDPLPTETAVPPATATRPPPTSTATATPTATPTLAPTTPSPTPTAAAAGPSGEDAARYVGLAIGAAVLGGLAIWGGLRVARGRQRSGGDVG
ncbi:MAG TPA: hypothetical protein VFR15_01270 [Chloroflexia bacterium]|nr:hypothetical protein [Chloroflexia bacterium]